VNTLINPDAGSNDILDDEGLEKMAQRESRKSAKRKALFSRQDRNLFALVKVRVKLFVVE
jgi:hypothetical protein